MAETIAFELVAPEKLIISANVEMVVIPGVEGNLGVLPGHAPLIANVRPGVVDVQEAGVIKEQIFVAGGFCEITPTQCTLLAPEAIKLSEIDKAVAEQRQINAREAEAKADSKTLKKAQIECRIADAILDAISK